MTEHEFYFAQLELQRITMRNAKRQLWQGLFAVMCIMIGLFLLVHAIVGGLR